MSAPERLPRSGARAALPVKGGPSPRNAWQAFSQAKRRWVESNPSATPEQYEAAMQALAQRFGV